jgi:integrase
MTCATPTQLWPSGMASPWKLVSKNLGHGSPAITLTVYRHVLDDELRATVVDLFPSLPAPQQSTHALLN